jgi:hypothetical protein
MRYTLNLLLISGLLCSISVHAQQNLFNIPSGDITPKNKFFYQHQFNFYALNDLESKSHVVYGVGKGWDLGINFVDLPLKFGDGSLVSFNDDSKRKPLYPVLMFTLQKQLVIKEGQWFLNIGTQTGANLSDEFANKRLATMNYSLVRWLLLVDPLLIMLV